MGDHGRTFSGIRRKGARYAHGRLGWSKRTKLGGARPPALSLVARDCPGLARQGRRRLLEFPDLPPNPAFHIAGRPNEVVLQFHLGQAAIARPTQTVRPHQLARRPFNGMAVRSSTLI